MSPDQVLAMLVEVASAVRSSLSGISEWEAPGTRSAQYGVDLVADEAALAALHARPVNVLSEESGLADRGHALTVIVDPLDGSTNASRRIPHYAVALCAVDDHGPLAAIVAHLADDRRWWATRGGGAFRDGVRLAEVQPRPWSDCVVAVSGRPPEDPGWGQFRAFGASAIDLCYVADGSVDAFIDMSPSAHGVWDYAASTLICREVGLRVGDAQGRELMVLDHSARRTPIATTSVNWDRALEVRRRRPL
jgi:fructose-1,6-bisphosphatase/inositol monophosphatase family enzyme